MKATGFEFGEVHDRFHEKIRRYLERMVGKAEADDLTQEVFLKISNGLRDFEGKSSLSTWVYRIATNAAMDKMRSRSFQERAQEVALGEPTVGSEGEKGGIDIEETSLSAEREAIRNEMNDCIREFVDRLPHDYRTVIILSEIRELKNQQIADILGISLHAAKIRLHRARARLKAEFEVGCDFYHDGDGRFAWDRKESEKNIE
jgi:RNA polymerase sigma-70 factor (ECF subfamily)